LALRERIGRGDGAALAARLHRMRARPGAREPERLILAVLGELAAQARTLTVDADRY
jgi:hypothetical protein